MKSYSDNVYIKGMKFSIKDAQGDEEKEEKFRESALLVLVEQGLLPAKRVFVQGSGPEKGRILRGVVRHAHPLGGKDNGTVVIAFLESWFAGQVNFRLNSGKKLKGGIRVVMHMPPILDALRNEALKARRQMPTADANRKIHLHKSLRRPWIQLVEARNGKKEPIDFPVDDSRLVNPSLTLAKMEKEGRDIFTPKMFLAPSIRDKIPPGVVKAKPIRAVADKADEDDDLIDDDDEVMLVDALKAL